MRTSMNWWNTQPTPWWEKPEVRYGYYRGPTSTLFSASNGIKLLF
jgi:hypothetical protein